MSARTIDDLRVGDQVHWDDVNGRGRVFEGTVTAVGRKLIKVERYVFRKDTGYTNDAYGHQRLIPDLAAHEEAKAAAKLFVAIRNTTSLSSEVTSADVRQAMKLLRIKEPA